MSATFGPGLHVPLGRAADPAAYEAWTGRWSRLFVPSVVAAAGVSPGCRALDMCTGTGEAAAAMLPAARPGGLVVGADIAPAMLAAARTRLPAGDFLAVAADGHRLPFAEGSFDAVVCQLGLQFFSDPAKGLAEFRRVLRSGGRAAVCVISVPERAPMWSTVAEAVSHFLPAQRNALHLSFSLSDPGRLSRMFSAAGFADVAVVREERSALTPGFDEYWRPIETGMGSIPQAYAALSEADRRRVREEVRARLARFETAAGLDMSVEMLIGSGTRR